MHFDKDTIVALATAPGTAAIAVIRLSGTSAFDICNSVFTDKNGFPKKLSLQKSHKLHYGWICSDNSLIDEVIISIFKAPHSYTGENTVEISCHGSVFIQQKIIQVLINSGARPAKAGEFTLRAFLNRKLDLPQAEAVADLIASDSQASHLLALNQMRGGVSQKINTFRQQLIHFASLIELELDFNEEDIEFANRSDLKQLVGDLQNEIQPIILSFKEGDVLKNGIPIAIVGKPNVGKSTLLNALLDEEKAIVSPIPGTTRDAIEDEIIIEGVRFRFIDTAGIRNTTDEIESIGVSKTFQKIKHASVVIYMFDVMEITPDELLQSISELNVKQILVVGNKIDCLNGTELTKKFIDRIPEIIYISAKQRINIHQISNRLTELYSIDVINKNDTVLTNARHFEALKKTSTALERVNNGLNSNLTGDLLAADIRNALLHIGEITGEITTDDLLENIFNKFCIGK